MVARQRHSIFIVSAGAQNLDLAVRSPDQTLNHAEQAAQDARIGYLTRLRQLKQEQFIDFALPVKLRPPSKITSCDQPCLAVIRAVVDRLRMRNFKRNDGDGSRANAVADLARDAGISLRLNH